MRTQRLAPAVGNALARMTRDGWSPGMHSLPRLLGAALVSLVAVACQSTDAPPAPAPLASLEDAQRCRDAGHPPDSEGYAQCLQGLEMMRRLQQQRDSAISNAVIKAQRGAAGAGR